MTRLTRWIQPKWLIQNVLPPALLTYFARTWYLCVTEIGPGYIGHELGIPLVGKAYSAFATISIFTISTLYIRLYFLPGNQSIPPRMSPSSISSGKRIYECLPPAEQPGADGEGDDAYGRSTILLNRCEKRQCGLRWKPPRTRHCSDCGTCRMGFDHHCAFFANCLTAPYIPTFLLTVIYTAPSVILLAAPLLRPLANRAVQAYSICWSDQDILQGWYGKTWSWFVAGGPVGRYVGGIILAWKKLDRADGGGYMRLEIGILAGVGIILAMMTMGLAASMIETIRHGDLTVDRERAKSFARIKGDIDKLVAKGKPIPTKLEDTLQRLTSQSYFWVPLLNAPGNGIERRGSNGVIVPTIPGERPYDLGPRLNWELYMGSGYGWLLPWKSWTRTKHLAATILDWPINPEVALRLKREAQVLATQR